MLNEMEWYKISLILIKWILKTRCEDTLKTLLIIE